MAGNILNSFAPCLFVCFLVGHKDWNLELKNLFLSEFDHFLLRFRLQIDIPFGIVGDPLGRSICRGQQIPEDFESFLGVYLGALRSEPG